MPKITRNFNMDVNLFRATELSLGKQQPSCTGNVWRCLLAAKMSTAHILKLVVLNRHCTLPSKRHPIPSTENLRWNSRRNSGADAFSVCMLLCVDAWVCISRMNYTQKMKLQELSGHEGCSSNPASFTQDRTEQAAVSNIRIYTSQNEANIKINYWNIPHVNPGIAVENELLPLAAQIDWESTLPAHQPHAPGSQNGVGGGAAHLSAGGWGSSLLIVFSLLKLTLADTEERRVKIQDSQNISDY